MAFFHACVYVHVYVCVFACAFGYVCLFVADARGLSGHGVYSVRLCRGGEWTTVVLDENMPCHPEAAVSDLRPEMRGK